MHPTSTLVRSGNSSYVTFAVRRVRINFGVGISNLNSAHVGARGRAFE